VTFGVLHSALIHSFIYSFIHSSSVVVHSSGADDEVDEDIINKDTRSSGFASPSRPQSGSASKEPTSRSRGETPVRELAVTPGQETTRETVLSPGQVSSGGEPLVSSRGATPGELSGTTVPVGTSRETTPRNQSVSAGKVTPGEDFVASPGAPPGEPAGVSPGVRTRSGGLYNTPDNGSSGERSVTPNRATAFTPGRTTSPGEEEIEITGGLEDLKDVSVC